MFSGTNRKVVCPQS